MSSRLASARLRLALVTFVTSGLLLCSAQAQTPGAAPAKTEGASAEASGTASHRPENGKNRLQRLEDALTRALQPFTSKQSLEPDLPPPVVQPPPVAPVMQNTRVKEMLDQRKNWMLMTPDDIILGKNHDNPLQIPEELLDNRQPKGASSSDRLRNNPNRSLMDPKKDQLEWNADPMGLNKSSNQRQEKRHQDEADLPSGVQAGIQNLRKMLGSDATAGAPTLGGNSSFSDFFGLGNRSGSVADAAAHKAYMEQYRQILESSSSSAAPSAPIAGQPLVNAAGLDAFSNSRRLAGDATTPAGLNALLHPGTLDDANAKVLNQWNPLYVPPKPEAPKPSPVGVPNVSVPRRKF